MNKISPEVPVVVAVSGGFDPLHIGHLRYLRAAKELFKSVHLVVILNSDAWLKRKKGYALLEQETRAEILRSIEGVDEVIIHESIYDDVGGALLALKPKVFAKGGDRVKGNVPEESLCAASGIEIIYGVGGEKAYSSSEIVKKAARALKEKGVL